MRRLPILLAPLLVLALGGCPQKAHGPVGHVKPQMAVVAWLSAVDGGDFDRAAALAPPDVSSAKRQVLVEALAEQFSGVKRVNDAPFALSPPDHGKITARVTLDYPGTGQAAVDLTLRKIAGKWYVVPPPKSKPKPKAAPAARDATARAPATPGATGKAPAAPKAPAPPAGAGAHGG